MIRWERGALGKDGSPWGDTWEGSGTRQGEAGNSEAQGIRRWAGLEQQDREKRVRSEEVEVRDAFPRRPLSASMCLPKVLLVIGSLAPLQQVN